MEEASPDEVVGPDEMDEETLPTRVNPQYELDALIRHTGLGREEVESWLRAIERKGQAILYGPPGTGKTWVAERLARHLVAGGDGIQEQVQFHPGYSYEDFIQGIRPRTDDGRLSYDLVPGRFLDFCDR